MVRILFICHGNICRSPMAEFVMKDMAARAGLAGRFLIESAATSAEELGNPVYPPVRRLLARHGIDCSGKTARRLAREDYGRFDLLVGMDEENLYHMRRILSAPPIQETAARREGTRGHMGGAGPQARIRLLLDFTGRPGPVADPWYTRDFDATWRDVNDGCRGLLEHCMRERETRLG